MKNLKTITTFIKRCFLMVQRNLAIPIIQLYITGNKWKKDIDNYSGSFLVYFDDPHFRYSACGNSYDIAKAVYYGLNNFETEGIGKYFLVDRIENIKLENEYIKRHFPQKFKKTSKIICEVDNNIIKLTLSKDFGSFATLVNGFFENAASQFGVEVDEFYSLLREFALREAELQRVRKNNYEFYEVFDIQNEEAVRT